MALTNENVKNDIISRYSIDDDVLGEQSITVYRSNSASNDQLTNDYLFGENVEPMVYASSFGATNEVVVIGDHTLQDSEDVFEEFNPTTEGA